jgi:Flp pilus assembly protein TadD
LVLSLSSFFLAALSKEPALTLPVILVIYAVLFRRPSDREWLQFLRRCVPYFFVIGAYFAMRVYALKGFAPLKTSSGLSFYETVINVFFIFTRYLEKMFVPVNLNVLYYVHPISSLFSLQGLISLLVTLLFLVITYVSFKKNRVVLLGLLFMAVPLLPALYLPGLVQKIEYAVTDRYLYLSSFGLVMLIAALISYLEKKKAKWFKGIGFLTLAVIAVFSVMTLFRNAVWKDNETLWRDSVRKSPESAFAHENLGYALFYRGQTEEGKRELQIAVGLDPGIPEAIISTGIAYSRKGLMTHAILAFNRAVLLKPNSPEARYNLGLAYDTRGWISQAIEQYRIALVLKPDHSDAHNNLGIIYGVQGSMDKAIEEFQAALRFKPDDPVFRRNLMRALQMKKSIDAETDTKSLKGNPSSE